VRRTSTPDAVLCPICGQELAFAKLRPEAIALGIDGNRKPGPYRFCPKDGAVFSFADPHNPVRVDTGADR
jgi:hypothetical protein